MYKLHTLDNAVKYSKNRISSGDVTLERYITTDNVLGNKQGVTIATNLPPKGVAMPSYSKHDILIANIRPYLKKIWYSTTEGGCSSDVLVLETKKEYFPKFVYYNLFKDEFFEHMMRGSKGTKMPRGDKNQILDFLIPDIKFDEQKRIANVLSPIDAKIELNNRINAELEAMAKTLYDYWFVQFDFPDENGKPYKANGGKMVWNEELKREIPDGWEVKKLKKILETSLGGTPSTKIEEYWNGNIPWLNSGEVADFPIVKSEANITKTAVDNSAAKLMPSGTVLLSITRHIRPSILAIDASANQSVVGIYESADLRCSYIYPMIQNEVPRFMTLRTGAQQPHINKETVDSTWIIKPSKDVLDKYYRIADPVYKKINNNAFENMELESLRDWLLPMMMNGQVSVGGVEELGMVAEDGGIYGK
jgi:type I restriction enzyme S subunit